MGVFRFILALSVVFAHAGALGGWDIVGGAIAVQSFFLISGFYMALILNEKYVGPHSYGLFISNRFLRLFPAYWGVLLLTLLVSGVSVVFFHKPSHLTAWVTYFSHLNIASILLLVLSNVVIFGQDIFLFMKLNLTNGSLQFTHNFLLSQPPVFNFMLISPAWSLSLELMFYLIAPFIVRNRMMLTLTIIAACLGLRIFLASRGLANDPWSYRFFPSELAWFLMGSVAYHLYSRIKNRYFHPFFLYGMLSLLYLSTLGYKMLPSIGYLANPLFKEEIYYAIVFLTLPYIFMVSKQWKWDRYIGELSYPIYICHSLIMTLSSHLPLVSGNALPVTTSVLSILFSIGLMRYIVIPIEAFRQARIRKETAVTPPRQQLLPNFSEAAHTPG